MGKVKRVRTKRHIEAVKIQTKDQPDPNERDLPNFLPNESKLPAVFPVNNLFKSSGEPSNTSASADHEDTTKPNSKKDRRKIRHEKFLRKLHASQMIKDDLAKTKQREQTVITGDLNPLTLALLDIDKLSTFTLKKTKRSRVYGKKDKRPASLKETKKQKAQLSDIEKFQQVLVHPAFQSNPLATIEEHVKNVIKKETKEC